ncbi:unnamed protein product [Ectocarpus sp. 12 AP-2014]
MAGFPGRWEKRLEDYESIFTLVGANDTARARRRKVKEQCSSCYGASGWFRQDGACLLLFFFGSMRLEGPGLYHMSGWLAFKVSFGCAVKRELQPLLPVAPRIMAFKFVSVHIGASCCYIHHGRTPTLALFDADQAYGRFGVTCGAEG